MDYDCGFLTVGIGGLYGQAHEGLVSAGVDRTRNFLQSVMPVSY